MKKLLVAAALVLAVGVGQASAAPLTGEVNYFGDFSINGSNFQTASEIAIVNAVASSTSTGDFLTAFGINFPDLLDHATPLGLDSTGAVMPLWSFPAGGPYTVQFFLTSYTVTQRTVTDLDLDGVGYFVATGFDQTPATWSLSAQLDTGQVRATYSASSIVPVPEPASMFLLGLGLVGLAGVARRRPRS